MPNVLLHTVKWSFADWDSMSETPSPRPTLALSPRRRS
jgi:hypothetical protein